MEGLGSLYTGVVVEYFSSSPNSDEINSLVSKLKNAKMPILDPSRLGSMPAGSILAMMIDNTDQNDLQVFYPLFPHINMPVKAGEQVIVIFGSAQRGDRIGYWLSRKPADLIAEDVNYTHNDRSNFTSNFNSTSLSSPNTPTPGQGFPDSGLTGIKYKSVIENSTTYQEDFQGEVVPRYFPKSTDLALQGSNNTLIVLGSSITLGKEKSINSGVIDIVTGRGQDERTKPASILSNVRSYEEVDKTKPRNPEEGDLDLTTDLSRINVAMNLNPDDEFNISVGENTGNSPSIVLKTDKVRVVARQDMKILVGPDGDPSSIVLKSNGDIIITPSSMGIIKLGGEDAAGAILATTDAVVTAGKVIAPSIVSTAGGILGAPGIPGTGIFSTKVLVKVT